MACTAKPVPSGKCTICPLCNGVFEVPFLDWFKGKPTGRTSFFREAPYFQTEVDQKVLYMVIDPQGIHQRDDFVPREVRVGTRRASLRFAGCHNLPSSEAGLAELWSAGGQEGTCNFRLSWP